MRNFPASILAIAILLVVFASTATHAELQTASLNAWADESSTYYEYFSDAFIRMSWRDPPPNELRQRFHSPIVNPTTAYGMLDGFPSENDFRMGYIEYDDAGLVDGNGVVALTDLVLGIRTDPLDPNYENWRRSDFTTFVESFSGTVSVINGTVTGVHLNAGIMLQSSNFLNNANPPVIGEYRGSYFVRDNRFQVAVDDDPVFPTLFTTDDPVRLAWDFTGTVLAVQSIGDFDQDGTYGCADLDSLVSGIANGPYSSTLDMNQDGQLTTSDLQLWLQQAGVVTQGSAFLSGDANLDGVVDGSDFGIWNNNKYSTTASWCSGDFTADGVVDGSDFGAWNANKFQASLVPEPVTLPWLFSFMIAAWQLMRRR